MYACALNAKTSFVSLAYLLEFFMDLNPVPGLSIKA